MKRQSMPSHAVIREYWWQKLTTIGKFAGRFEVFAGDYCFACGLESPLHRAHIMAHRAGGHEKPSNIHLLCPTCHSESERFHGDEYWRWFLAKRPGDGRMTTTAKQSFGPRIERTAKPQQPAPTYSAIVVNCPATLVVDDVAGEVIAHVDMSAADDGRAVIPQGANTRGYAGDAESIGPFNRHEANGSILTLRWTMRPEKGRVLLAIGRACTASLSIQPIEQRRASMKDAAVFGESIRAVANKWRLLKCNLSPVASAAGISISR